MTNGSYERYSRIVKNKGYSNYKVAKETGLSQSVFTNWKNRNTLPSTETLMKLCDFLDISLDMLLATDNDNNAKQSPTRTYVLDQVNRATEAELEALSGYLDADPKKRRKINEIMKLLENEEHYE